MKIVYDQWVNGNLVGLNDQFYFVAAGMKFYKIDKTIIKEIYYKERLLDLQKLKTINFDPFISSKYINQTTINEKYAWAHADKTKFISKENKKLFKASQSLKHSGISYLLSIISGIVGGIAISNDELEIGSSFLVLSSLFIIFHASELISAGNNMTEYIRQMDIAPLDSTNYSALSH